MSAILQSYQALSSSSPRSTVASVLQSIINARPLTFDKYSRADLIRVIIVDLKEAGLDSRLTQKDAAKALLAVKTLGRDPAGSESLATPETLSTLLYFARKFENNPDASTEALRCVANTLLLFDNARSVFLSKDVNGGDVTLTLLEKATTAPQVFISSRILFLSTVSSALVLSFFEGNQHETIIGNVVSDKLDLLMPLYFSEVELAKEALVDLLKFSFNLLLQYPKVYPPPNADSVDKDVDPWNPNLNDFLAPLLRVLYTLPPSSPPLTSPLTHVIHSLMTIPVNKSLHPIWFADGSSDETSSVAQDIIAHTFHLLEATLAHYFPGNIEVDDPSVRERPVKENLDGTLDELCSPLIVLVTRLCLANEPARARMREWIVPHDLDRSSPLEHRPDLLGRCLRLMGSVYHPRLKDSIGEMLFAICNSDASILSSLVGYGNVAGLLFNKGVMSAPPAPSSATGGDVALPEEDNINPITGNTMPKPQLPEMTEEEKEAEVEKLFVLFDRLERTGVLPPEQNPIRKAIEKSQSA